MEGACLRVINKRMTILKTLKFIFFNVLLPLCDIGTDFQAFLVYLLADDHRHPYWALLTLFWIFNPFLVHLCKFVAILFLTKEADWKNLCIHIPFVIPLNNCYYAYQLHKLNFGERGEAGEKAEEIQSKWTEAEEIQRKVAKASLSESYYEAGPQAAQQLIISFSIGHFRWNIIVSITISLVSLSWGASRTFFIERGEDQADPDPSLDMVGLRVFPWMVLMVSNSLVMWVLLGGLLGPWVFLVLPINFLCNYTTVKCLFKFKRAVNKREEKDMESGQEMIEVSKQDESLTKTLGTSCETFFPLKTSSAPSSAPRSVQRVDQRPPSRHQQRPSL